MQVIKRRQNKKLAARIVAETIRAQALVMDRKGNVSHSVFFRNSHLQEISNVEEKSDVML